jgi:mono/diheme cytochrome c family protein
MDKTNIVEPVSRIQVRNKQVVKKGRSIWALVVLLAALLVLMLVLAGCSSSSSQATQAPASSDSTSLDGAALLETRCSVCHSADRATRASKTLEEWDVTVTRMINKGARLTEAEKSVLLDYLAKTYGP